MCSVEYVIDTNFPGCSMVVLVTYVSVQKKYSCFLCADMS